MASEWENLVVGFFHAQRAAAKKARRPSLSEERFNERALERLEKDRRVRQRLQVLELQALIERAWWDHCEAVRNQVFELQAERDAFERTRDAL